MPRFNYRALDAGGSAVSGVVDADNEAQAVTRLAAEKRFVVNIAEGDTGGVRRTGRVKRADVARFTRQLATLLAAGVPLARGLGTVCGEEPNLAFRAVLEDVRDKIHAGQALSEALGAYPSVFPRLYVSLVRVGEAGGVLDRMCIELAEFLERDNEIRSSVVTALIYPTLVAGLGISIVVVFMTFVFPRLLAPLVQMQMQLPLPTRVLQAISQWFVAWWWLLAAAVVAGVFAWRAYVATGDGRARVDAVKLRIPLIGLFAERVAIMRFAMTLATLLKCGVPVVEALEIVRDVVGNEHLGRALDRALGRIRHGGTIADTLLSERFLPPMAAQMVSVGEESGRLDEVLGHMACSYDAEVKRSVRQMEAVLGPAVIVVIGVFVGFIIVSVLIPVLDVSGSMGM